MGGLSSRLKDESSAGLRVMEAVAGAEPDSNLVHWALPDTAADQIAEPFVGKFHR